MSIYIFYFRVKMLKTCPLAWKKLLKVLWDGKYLFNTSGVNFETLKYSFKKRRKNP